MENIESQREAENEILMMKAKERKVRRKPRWFCVSDVTQMLQKHMMQKAEEAARRAPKTEMELVFEAENKAVLKNGEEDATLLPTRD